MKKWLLFGITILTILSSASTFKILAFLPFPMKSHQIVFNSLLFELVLKGHEVTVYSNTPLRNVEQFSTYKHIHVTSVLESSLENKFSFENIRSRLDMEAFIRPMGFQIITRNLTNDILSLLEVKNLLNSDEHFDVVILEAFFGQEAFVGLGHRFNAPIVSLSSFGTFSFPDSILGNPNPLAYFSTYQLAFTSDLTFYQKLKNLVATLSELHYSYYHHLPYQQQVLDKHFSHCVRTPLPRLVTLLSDIDIVLMNTQPEVSYARPWLPNTISVGGFHIQKDRKPLPQDVQTFINGADKGLVYFSLGSTFSGATIPEYITNALVETFKKIPQRVIWKIDVAPSSLPSNVMTVEWIRQNDILAHPKCVAFITHGGLLSILEAVNFAVPIVGIPVFADQPWNVVKAEAAEIGVRLRVLNVSSDSVYWALQEVLQNPKYKTNIKALSARMRDRQVSPIDSAVYWVEYVARHHGTPDLKSPARHMSYFQYLLIDIILFLFTVVLLVFILLYISIKTLLRIAKLSSKNKRE